MAPRSSVVFLGGGLELGKGPNLRTVRSICMSVSRWGWQRCRFKISGVANEVDHGGEERWLLPRRDIDRAERRTLIRVGGLPPESRWRSNRAPTSHTGSDFARKGLSQMTRGVAGRPSPYACCCELRTDTIAARRRP